MSLKLKDLSKKSPDWIKVGEDGRSRCRPNFIHEKPAVISSQVAEAVGEYRTNIYI